MGVAQMAGDRHAFVYKFNHCRSSVWRESEIELHSVNTRRKQMTNFLRDIVHRRNTVQHLGKRSAWETGLHPIEQWTADKQPRTKLRAAVEVGLERLDFL